MAKQGNYVDVGPVSSLVNGVANTWNQAMKRVSGINPITNAPRKQVRPEAEQLRRDVEEVAARKSVDTAYQPTTSAFIATQPAPKPVLTQPAPTQAAPTSTNNGRVQVPIAVPDRGKTQPGPKPSLINGLSPAQFDKLVELESGRHGYTALHEGSKAYGRYQFIPSTAAEYSARLGFKGDEWKTPENQDKMFQAFTYDNIRKLVDNNMPVNMFNIYGSHQQGSTGFRDIMNNNITPKLERSMRSNLPGSDNLSGQELRTAWINHWKERTQL